MIRELRIWWRLRPYISKIQEQSRMKLSVNAVVQILGTALQGLNTVVDLLPARGRFWAFVAVSAIQGVVGILAHFSNPDGTSAAAPYIPAR